MKKSLVALAVLGAFAAAASAQSSVTIYRGIDLAITKGNGGTAPNNGGNGTSTAWQEKQSSGSRLGFRGNEDLGGGLSAQFQIEHRFTPDDDAALAAPSPFWAARSYVQLSSDAAGRVYLGREYLPVFWPAFKSDPFGWDGVARIEGLQFAGYSSGHSSFIRSNNAVGYRSPSFAGLTINAAVGLGEGTLPRTNGFTIEYGAGPIYAALGYDKLKGGPVASLDGNSLVNLAFNYDLGVVKPMLYYARAKVGTNRALSNKIWSLGALAPIGPGTLKAAYTRLTPDSAVATAIGFVGDGNGRQSKFGLGYDYFLSKRTNVMRTFRPLASPARFATSSTDLHSPTTTFTRLA